VASTPSSAPLNLGFLSILQEGDSYLGGYMVTNQWGRPLEFRLSSAVQPNKVQQVLYAATLVPYICADLIGKALVDKTAAPAQLVITDREAVLDLRLRIEAPVVWLAPPGDPRAGGPTAVPAPGRGALLCHPRYVGDPAVIAALLAQLEPGLDLAEPFGRVRSAVGEARKLGVTARAA
jgi:hypothetical protein